MPTHTPTHMYRALECVLAVGARGVDSAIAVPDVLPQPTPISQTIENMCYRHVYRNMCNRHVYRNMCYRHVYRNMCNRHVYRNMCNRHVYRKHV